MNGIRIELEIGGEREKVYFATRRSSQDGDQMRKAQRLFHENRLSAARIATRITVVAAQADVADLTLERLEELDAQVGKLAEQAREFSEQTRNCAEQFVRLRAFRRSL